MNRATPDTAYLLQELQTHRLEIIERRHELEAYRIELEQQNEELRAAEEEATAARDRYAELYESAPIAYFTLGHGGEITAVNAAGAALLDVASESLRGRKLGDLVAVEYLETYLKFLSGLIFSHCRETCHLLFPRPGRSLVYARLEGCFSKSGREFLVAASDVTERWYNEVALSAARDAAEEANRAKSAFLANMSHEMRTPLHIIVGMSHLLRRDISDSAQQQRLDQLRQSSDLLLELINEVLDLSRIEANRLILDRQAFCLGDVLRRVTDVIGSPAQAKGLQLTIDISPVLNDAVFEGDALRLTQVLINLGTNAIKFTETGSVRLAVIAGSNQDDETLNFSIEDTGIGISAADQAHLFEAFSQADNSSTRSQAGSGLGLTISQRLVGLMGGSIEVSSHPGVGSRFSFQLRLSRAEVFPCAKAETPSADLGGRCILLAEDHPLSQEILFEMLEDLGCEVEVASDGNEAVKCAESRDYDLILMDMQMPKLDGLGTTREIRRLPHHHDTPIVALTANAFADDRQRCLDAGMNDHLGKPVTPQALGAMLSRWLPSLKLAESAIASDPGADPVSDPAPAPDIGIAGVSPPASMCGSPQRDADYRKLLQRFADLHGEDMKRLEVFLESNGRDEALRLAHDLKGIAGFVGARDLALQANEIVVALRNDVPLGRIMPLVSRCATELNHIVSDIARLGARQG